MYPPSVDTGAIKKKRFLSHPGINFVFGVWIFSFFLSCSILFETFDSGTYLTWICRILVATLMSKLNLSKIAYNFSSNMDFLYKILLEFNH